MKLYAVRHGQAQHNRQFKLNDDPASSSDLTAKGRAQAEAVAEQLKDLPIEQIYTSQLPRAVQTADIINAHRRVKQVTDARLNEIKSGFHGRAVGVWVVKRLLSRENLQRRHHAGESLAEAKARIESFLQELKSSGQQAVLIVAHQHTLQALDALINGTDYKKALRRPIGHMQVLEFEL